MIRACQQSTGWEEAIEGAIIRRDRWLIELKAMKAEQHVQQHQQHQQRPHSSLIFSGAGVHSHHCTPPVPLMSAASGEQQQQREAAAKKKAEEEALRAKKEAKVAEVGF